MRKLLLKLVPQLSMSLDHPIPVMVNVVHGIAMGMGPWKPQENSTRT